MIKKDVKKNLLDHSEAKVKLLGEYLRRYLNIICNDQYTSKIKIFDLFCGEGLYENGGEGSPLVILRQVKDAHFSKASKSEVVPKLDCCFNDIDIQKVEKVKRVISEKSLHYPEFGNLNFSSKDYPILLEELFSSLPKANGEKFFIFIDPYEYKHIKASQIKRLMASGSTEVLLWLPTQFMYRFANNGTPEALKDFISELFPNFNEWKSKNVWDFINQLKSGFQSYLGKDFFVDNFTIQKDYNTVFCLFFFTSHIKGFEKMLESKWGIDSEQGKGWNYHWNQRSLFYEHKTNPLEDKLKEYLANNIRYNGEIYEFTLRQGFLPTHTNEVLSDFQTNGLIEVLKVNGEKARKKSFYIAYKYFKNDNKKVYFKWQNQV